MQLAMSSMSNNSFHSKTSGRCRHVGHDASVQSEDQRILFSRRPTGPSSTIFGSDRHVCLEITLHRRIRGSTHKRDYLCHFDLPDLRSRFELLSSAELWRIYSLGQKYRSLVERKL